MYNDHLVADQNMMERMIKCSKKASTFLYVPLVGTVEEFYRHTRRALYDSPSKMPKVSNKKTPPNPYVKVKPEEAEGDNPWKKSKTPTKKVDKALLKEKVQ